MCACVCTCVCNAELIQLLPLKSLVVFKQLHNLKATVTAAAGSCCAFVHSASGLTGLNCRLLPGHTMHTAKVALLFVTGTACCTHTHASRDHAVARAMVSGFSRLTL